jgi:hypothetical protein
MPQGNSLHHYLKQKCHFVFYENREQRGRIGPVWGTGTSVCRGIWGENVGG